VKIVDRFARAFVRGDYGEMRTAGRDCRAALVVARKDAPDGSRLYANRSAVAVREKLRVRVRKLGGRTSRRAWARQELKLLEGYARALASGKYPSAVAAAADYQRDTVRLRRRYPKAAWLASRHLPDAVAQRLRDRAHRLGLPPGPKPWSRAETCLLDAYARAIVRGEYPDAGVAARALVEDLGELAGTGAGTGEPRTYAGVHGMLWSRARELGRPFLSLPWSPKERALANMYARRLALGRFRNAWDAAVSCSRDLSQLRREHPQARWASMQRTTLGVWAQIWHRADRLGLKWTESLWVPAEERIVARHARDVVLGRYPSAKSAAPDCWRELERFHRVRRQRKLGRAGRPGPRTLRAICGKIEVRTSVLRQTQRIDG